MASAVRLLPLVLFGGLSSAALAATPATTLSLQGVSFQVTTQGTGSVQQLVVKASEHGHAYPVVKQELLGSLTGREVEDLNGDGRPELILLVTSAGSGSYGSVLAWSASKGHTLLPVTRPELSGKLAQGYRGHDQFAVVETTLMRRFPIYRPGDTNAEPTGGTRQISYKLVASEAGFLFKPVGDTTFR
jgi:hypothetical protein